ncbi:hypothetical protein FRC09_006780 [Ceratobasidium sp. 395]|nr:hypothetical protein FRC09_006780 [Ceratobasidium sp. 395]
MAYSKAGKVVEGYSLSELSSDRDIADLTFRPDFFTKLVKLLTLAQCRSDKAFDDTRRSPDLVVKTDMHACSPVSVNLGDAASKSTDTLRSSSESDAPFPGLAPAAGVHDPFERIMPTRVARSPKGRNKRERKGARRKGRVNARTLTVQLIQKPELAEPTTTLTPIPEIASVFERNSCLAQLNFTSTEHLVTEDALMDTDSSRARAAIALARAQLEHSRPASIHRKRERATNKMMMLPGEFEEYQATQPTPPPVERISTPDFGDVFNPDADTMRRTVEQSSSMVLTLMAAREAVSLRAESKKNSHAQAASISTIDLLKECQSSFPELYKPGDAPLSPPPSIPLPQVPPPAAMSLPTPRSPTRDRSRRSKASPRNSLYNGLPTEYDGSAIQRVDTLIQDLLETRSQGTTSRARSHSSASSGSRRERIADMPNARTDYDINRCPQTTALPELVSSRRPSHCVQTVVRNPSDGAPLTPAPTPPISSLAPPLKSSATRCNVSVETEAGACRGAQSGTFRGSKAAVPSGQTLSYFQPSASPQRPVRPQSLMGPDPPKWLVEAEAKQLSRSSNKALVHPPGITSSNCPMQMQNSSVAALTPQGSPQKSAYAGYRYI